MRRRPFFVLFGKELREQVKSYRLLILGLVFVFFGLASPLLAKFTPDTHAAPGKPQGCCQCRGIFVIAAV